jgi:hypothetical protein
MVSGMTTTPDREPATGNSPHGAGAPPTSGVVVPDAAPRDLSRGVRTEVLLWFLAMCARCGDDLAQPFRVEADRDDWAAKHVADTGHVVRLTVDGLDNLPGLHLCGVISRDQNGGYRYVCPADTCGTSNGPYSTPQLAIVSWRNHPVSVPA